MKDLNGILNNAVTAGDVPFVVAMSGNSSGVTWSGVAGERAPGIAATEDTVFRIFSMTKAIGSTAAMILMDRGKLSPDTPVEAVLPQFSDIKILDGFDGDTPRLRAPKIKATVRHLATHTSGFVYGLFNSDMPKYLEATGHPEVLSGLKASLNCPLVFEPGERWDYGIGIDWLGQVVEAVDGRRIDAFCREEIFDPLGMPDTNFEVTDKMAERLATVQARGEDGQFSDFDVAPPSDPEFYGMGHALYSTAPDYMRFLRMFLNKGQMDGIEKTHSLGFMRMEEDVAQMRTAGSQSWAGILNTHFWFDQARDVAGVIMTQSLPFGEPRFMEVYDRFERAVYANVN
jgi:methyl acetate hydrolase